MSSYGSNRSGYLHPQYQQQQPQPPYPTTPAGQPSNYFPPIPEQQPVYSSSPTQAFYSTSPTSPRSSMPQPSHRRTSSTSSYNSQRPTQLQQPSMPIPIRQPMPAQYQHTASYPPTEQYQHVTSYPPQVTYAQLQPMYTRSTSQQSEHPRTSEDKYEEYRQQYHGGLDPETEREYRRRYAKNKEFERRPTLGGSLLSMVGKVGRAFGGTDRR